MDNITNYYTYPVIIHGSITDAKVFASKISDVSYSSIKKLCSQPWMKDISPVFMPDVSPGKCGTNIGTVLPYKDKIWCKPVGSDAGCGITSWHLTKDALKKIDFNKLDEIYENDIPTGVGEMRSKSHKFLKSVPLNNLAFSKKLTEKEWTSYSNQLGTPGGGNHFGEIDLMKDGTIRLNIHTGSRGLGRKIYDFYTQVTKDYYENLVKNNKTKNPELTGLDYACLSGQLMNDYINDINIAQIYAYYNRQAIFDTIASGLGLTSSDIIDMTDCPHNFIDTKNKIIYKGAVQVNKDQTAIVPTNIVDGCIIVRGLVSLGYVNHGLGRCLSTADCDSIDNQDVLDLLYLSGSHNNYCENFKHESPMAYKNTSEVMGWMWKMGTVEFVESSDRVLYNHKAINK